MPLHPAPRSPAVLTENFVLTEQYCVATLESREAFRGRVQTLYQQIVKEKKPQTVVIGDGAHWIWEMASEQFPNSIGLRREQKG